MNASLGCNAASEFFAEDKIRYWLQQCWKSSICSGKKAIVLGRKMCYTDGKTWLQVEELAGLEQAR